jgi:transposase, IS5 family
LAHADLEGIMAQRRIGQEVFRFGGKAARQTSLDELGALINWPVAEQVLARLYPATKGEKAWPPLAMFKALLLATWYDLSDVALAEALADRASFRRFCGFACDEATPERTAFVRFRRLLVAQGLDRSLFAAIARDLESKGASVRKGTLVDATVIGSASKGDKEAAWVRHRTHARPRAWVQGPHCRRQGHRHHPKGRDHSGQRARCLDCSRDYP